MKMHTKSGAAIAAAAATLMFASAGVTLSTAPAMAKSIKCTGANACKGQSACKSGDHACKGQNACKGQGFSMLSKKACAKAGGTEG